MVESNMCGWDCRIQDVHLFDLHVPVELLQLGRLYALQFCKVVITKGLKLTVHVVWMIFPVMITMTVSITVEILVIVMGLSVEV